MVDRDAYSMPSDDLFRPDRIVASPDGATAAFVVAATSAGDDSRAGIWAGPLDGAPTRLSGEMPVTNLAYDGSRLAYAIAGDAGAAVLVIRDVAGSGEPVRRPVTGYPEKVAWTPEGTVAMLVAEPGADAASLSSGKPLLADAAPTISIRSTATPQGWRRLWLFDPTGGDAVAISPAELSVWEFACLGDDRVVAICSPDPTEAGWYHPTLAILGPTPDNRRDLHESTWQLSCPTIDPERRRVAFLEGWTSDRGLHTGDIRICDLNGGGLHTVPVDDIDVTWIRWSGDDRLWLAGWAGLRTTWGWIGHPTDRDARVTLHAEAGECMNSRWHPEVVPLPGDRALTVYSTAIRPPEVAVLGTETVSWTTVNAHVPTDRGLAVREMRWPDPVGVGEIEGLLVVPTRGTGPWPLAVDIHGGPTLAFHHSWDLGWAEILTTMGYAVLMPNPVGGAGRGQEFGRRNLGDPAGAEFEQVLAGAAHCVKQGYADPDRVAALGASYGGYLTAWALARGDVFRCGVVIAGISNLASCRGTANNGPFYDYLCAGKPNENPSLYADRSPVSILGPHSRPALILHGELDQCVPVTQAHELFVGLRDAGVPADLVVYPGEGHQTQAIAYVRDQRARVLTWLSAYCS